jgi:hypothetical protein
MLVDTFSMGVCIKLLKPLHMDTKNEQLSKWTFVVGARFLIVDKHKKKARMIYMVMA